MTRLVVDASTVLTWCFPDEKARKAQEISELIAAGERIAVPEGLPQESLAMAKWAYSTSANPSFTRRKNRPLVVDTKTYLRPRINADQRG
jgi:hypothetical protein